MPELVDVERHAWSALSSATGASFRGTTLVCGPGARQVGDALLALGASTIMTQEATVAAEEENPADDTVDTVVLLHAWESPDRVDVAARAATGWLRPGGWLVLADLDVERLATAPSRIYPSATLYRMFPQVRRHVAARCAGSIGLVTAAVRAGLDGKAAATIDRPVAVYASRSELRAGVEFGTWRGLEQLDAEQYSALVDSLAVIDVPSWPLVEVEPWVVVAGMSRV